MSEKEKKKEPTYEERQLDQVVDALERDGVLPQDSIQNLEIGTKVTSVLNTFGITPEAVQKWLGIEECGCKKRQKFLNGVLSFIKPPKKD